MSITQKDIKLLWGRAASRCSICRLELIHYKQNEIGSFAVGEQAHIVAEEESGPRGKSSLSLDERNSYSNLILLCSTHHVVIDHDPTAFPVERLHFIKARHEIWVQEVLSEKVNYDEASPISELFVLAESLKRILRWSHEIVPPEAAGSYFEDLQYFWSIPNPAVRHIDKSLTHAIDCLLRTLAVGGPLEKNPSGTMEDYSRKKLAYFELVFARYFRDRGITYREMADEIDLSLFIENTYLSFSEIIDEGYKNLDETERAIIRFVLSLLRYFRKYLEAQGHVTVSETIITELTNLLKPNIGKLGYQLRDTDDYDYLPKI